MDGGESRLVSIKTSE